MKSTNLLSLSFLPFLLTASGIAAGRTFSVLQYGAVSDNATDNAWAFLRAWRDACEWKDGISRVLVPTGTYYLTSVVFKGPCHGPIHVIIQALLTAPIVPRLFLLDHWITFRNVNHLKIYGGGILDGQGAFAWPFNRCSTGVCSPLPASLRLDYVNDSEIANVRSVNSKQFHVNVFACHRLKITGVTLSAPRDSPNTDGIHVAKSEEVRVKGAEIGTGDDCISIGPGCRGVHISKVTCGPGHGISIGSMGRGGGARSGVETVAGVTVVNCTLVGTTNGVQIKTWPNAAAAGGYVTGVVYDGIVVKDVRNPIFINQQYCPHNLCRHQESSTIHISNVTYKNIRGTSRTKEAVKLNCSRTNPCRGIVLDNINIVRSSGSTSLSSCSNAYGHSKGLQVPPPCLVQPAKVDRHIYETSC